MHIEIGNAVQWIFDQIKDKRERSDIWLLLGKGPTLNFRDKFSLGDYDQIMSLNHACKVRPITLAHFTDIEAFYDCREALMDHQPHVVLPWYPHVNMAPGRFDLHTRAQTCKELQWFASRGKLLSYNSSRATTQVRHPGLPLIMVRLFSAVAAVNLLAEAGLRKLHTLGIDGGTGYADDFDLKDCLKNGQSSFSVQFEEIRKTSKRYDMAIKPLVRADYGTVDN